jgi:redox-sensitive bicupin YhaK (pirin superfamily)
MTAASGLLHKEFHDMEFANAGGNFHMVQLWVNLPAEKKMSFPK